MALSFLKKGAESTKMAEQAAAEAEMRKQGQDKPRRFWLKQGETAPVTFVDGDLDDNGFLIPPRYFEHSILLNGEWEDFVCPAKTQPDVYGNDCPNCEQDRPSLVALFTIIDHRQFASKKDPNKTYADTKKLLVVKPTTFEILNKIAIKRGGLAGCRFDVSRVGEKAAAVGSMFDFTDKLPLADLKAKYVLNITDPKTGVTEAKTNFEPFDYEQVIVFRTPDELRKLGLGKTASVSGMANPGGVHPGATQQTGTTNYASQL